MADEFKIKFRGVRGSYPVADKDFLKYGGNTKKKINFADG